MALPQHNRLRSSRDFSKVYRKGRRAATKHIAIRAFKARSVVNLTVSSAKVQSAQTTHSESKGVGGFPSALSVCSKPGPHFGISISRKVHKHAVVRNRIKRQLKAIIREHFLAIAPHWQIVIIVRPPAVECSFDEFLRELEYLLQKLAVTGRIEN